MADKTDFKLSSGDGSVSEDTSSVKRPCLVMIKGDFIGEVYELDRGVIQLGRSDEVDLPVSDTSISRRHAMIVRRVDGFYVSDLGSTNGTFLNREVVSKERLLEEGDKITLGKVTFKFTYQDDDDTEYHMLLRNMAVKDGLTRIYNKRHFMESLAKEFEFNQRNHVGLSIIMFDIDHFKDVNDTHGHPAGDAVLRGLAQLVEKVARGYDLFARYGGEEFVLLMRDASLESAVALAERIRSAVEVHQFSYEETTLRITASFGVYHWDGNEEIGRAEALIDFADKQLYRAKQNGRNQVCY